MCKPPFRFWVGVLIFFTTFMSFSLRINLSIGIIGMAGNADENPYCLENNQQRSSSGEQFNWDEDIQAELLAAYSYGFSITGMMGGYIAENFGPYNTINVINILQLLFNSLSVWGLDIYAHWIVLFVMRLILGCFGGMVYPASHVLISKWAPPKERGRFTTALRGNVLGTAVTYPLVGAITQNVGWRWGFHITSLLFLVYTIIFWIVGGNDPQKHKWVTEYEKDFILTSQMGSVSLSNIKKVPPYLAIFTSIHFWALNIAHFGNGWGLYLLMTGLAKFLTEILGFDLRTSGIYSSFPYVLCLILSLACGAIADFAVHHWNFNKIILRKTFITFSHIIPGICLCLMIFMNCNSKAMAIVLLTLAQGVNGASVVTNLQNAQDLAPNFAGSIFGIINTFAGLTGVFTPMLTAALIDEYGGLKGYQLSFFIGGIIYIATGLFFIIFGSSELQKWNEIIE